MSARVKCSGCERSWAFDTERHAIEFVQIHSRYERHDAFLEDAEPGGVGEK